MPETLIYCPVKCTLVYRLAEHRPARRVQEASQRALPGLRAGERVWTGNLPGAHSRELRLGPLAVLTLQWIMRVMIIIKLRESLQVNLCIIKCNCQRINKSCGMKTLINE